MLAGLVILEDITICYSQNEDNTISYKITNTYSGESEDIIGISSVKFFKALSIAVHNDGTPDYEEDYPDAEDIMLDIRWIP